MDRIEFTVNGQLQRISCPPAKTLLDVLREDLGLTGAKECCGKGECGSCSTIVDGELVCSCLVLAGQVQGLNVRTVEGLSVGGKLDPLQQAFIEEGATQCGYCTPGIVVAARAYLDQLQTIPTREGIQTAMAGNLCRCTGYVKIIDAIEKVANERLTGREFSSADI